MDNGWYEVLLHDGVSTGYISGKLVRFIPAGD
jgi:hypothetical protein